MWLDWKGTVWCLYEVCPSDTTDLKFYKKIKGVSRKKVQKKGPWSFLFYELVKTERV